MKSLLLLASLFLMSCSTSEVVSNVSIMNCDLNKINILDNISDDFEEGDEGRRYINQVLSFISFSLDAGGIQLWSISKLENKEWVLSFIKNELDHQIIEQFLYKEDFNYLHIFSKHKKECTEQFFN